MKGQPKPDKQKTQQERHKKQQREKDKPVDLPGEDVTAEENQGEGGRAGTRAVPKEHVKSNKEERLY